MFFLFLSASSFVSVWCAFVLKNDLKTSPPKVFFFEDFLNFSTSRQLVIFSPFYTHARTNNTQTFREEEEEESEREIRLRVVVSVVFMVVLVEE